MADPDHDDIMLERLLDAARDAPPDPGADLMARVLADARRLQPRPAEGGQMAVHAGRGGATVGARARGRLRDFLGTLGGWPAVAGLGAVALTGLWLGVSPPAALDQASAPYFSTVELLADDDVLYGFDVLLAEG
ncbi:hypothetical protein [Brevirhabdus sp.]|uniref:hypothetical protein n=1 Tax=Brevirhabdus sp. TaxID=2004514 RepID=UPI00405861AF